MPDTLNVKRCPIFVSYKRKDSERVFELVADLERKLGVKCWVDIDGIETRSQFASKICSAIDAAQVVLFFHSRNHLNIDFEEDWTIKELNYAHAKKKYVVLVKLDSAPLENIFLMEYGTKNNIDSNVPMQWQKLVNELRRWLNLPEPSRAESTSKPSEPQPTVVNRPKVQTSKPLRKLYARKGRNSKWGFSDENHRLVIPCIFPENKPYQGAYSFSEGVACVMKGDRWGLIDADGNDITEFKYRSLQSCSENRIVAQDEKYNWGCIDRSGNTVIPFGKFKSIGSFADGRAVVSAFWKKGLFSGSSLLKGYIDVDGEFVVEPQYVWGSPFGDGLAVVYKGEDKRESFGINPDWKCFVIAKDGSKQFRMPNGINAHYNHFNDGMLRVESNIGSPSRKGFVDKNGKIVVPVELGFAWDFCEGVAIVSRKGDSRCYFIDTDGRELPIGHFADAHGGFSEGLCPVSTGRQYGGKNGKYGLIDKTGNLVVPYMYDWMDFGFEGGLIRVRNDDVEFYIDHEGRRIEF